MNRAETTYAEMAIFFLFLAVILVATSLFHLDSEMTVEQVKNCTHFAGLLAFAALVFEIMYIVSWIKARPKNEFLYS
jgi:hypothetical protein